MLAPCAIALLLIGTFVIFVGWAHGAIRRCVAGEHSKPPATVHAAAAPDWFVYRDKFHPHHDLRL